MKNRVNTRFFLFLLFTVVSFQPYAEDFTFTIPEQEFVLPDLHQIDSFHWQHLESSLSDSGYEQPNTMNQHLLYGSIQGYLENKLSSLGIPQTAVTLTGAAVIFAAGQDAMLNLNKSKTMSLQFKDIRDNERAILYRLKYSW